MDIDSIREDGTYVYAWRLVNNLVPDEWGDMSAMVYHQINCQNKKFKRIKFVSFDMPMAKGNITTNALYTDDMSNWNNIVTGSNDEMFIIRVCCYEGN